MNSSESSQPLWDPRQITFLILNRFWSLGKIPFFPPPHFLGLLRLHGIPTKIEWQMKNASLSYIKFQGLRRYFGEKLQDTTARFFFLFYISFYISRYHFYNFLECHSTLSGKDFCSKFSFFNRFTPSLQHQPLNGQNLLDVTKVFCQFSLKCLLKYFFSRIFWQNFVKHFWKGSNYRLSGLLFRTYFKNSYFDTRISNYL